MGQFPSRVLAIFNIFGSENAVAGQGMGETLNSNEDGAPKTSGTNHNAFGSHFLMGGEVFIYGERKKLGSDRKVGGDKFDTGRPDTFLFGDGLDLELLGNKPVKFPYDQSKGISDSVNVLYSLVNIRRDSVKFVKVENMKRPSHQWNYRLEFIFDCDVSCYIQIHYCAKEIIDSNYVQIVSKYLSIDSSEKFYFENGPDQLFDKYIFKSHRYDTKLMHYDGGLYFPVVIEIRTTDNSSYFSEQVQTTLCSIERSVDQSSTLLLKPLKQKLIVDGVAYLVQEIFGLENKEQDQHLSIDESGGECIICMANPRDTVILPCRHLCICNGCAETLRYKLNNCPICRSPFKALLKLKTLRSGNLSGNFNTSGTGRMRHENVTLMEALNGPYQNNQRLLSTFALENETEIGFPLYKRPSLKLPSQNNKKFLSSLNTSAKHVDETEGIELETIEIEKPSASSFVADKISYQSKLYEISNENVADDDIIAEHQPLSSIKISTSRSSLQSNIAINFCDDTTTAIEKIAFHASENADLDDAQRHHATLVRVRSECGGGNGDGNDSSISDNKKENIT